VPERTEAQEVAQVLSAQALREPQELAQLRVRQPGDVRDDAAVRQALQPREPPPAPFLARLPPDPHRPQRARPHHRARVRQRPGLKGQHARWLWCE
jgi:hypothetical protein